MARTNDQSGKIIAWVIILSIVSAVWTWLKETFAQLSIWAGENTTFIVTVIVALVGGLLVLSIAGNRANAREAQARIDALKAKYQDDDVVQKILNKEYWIGATEQMVLDSIGAPDDKDSEVMKTKIKETWKYGKKQANQYRLRIYLENGRVTKWEHKG